MHRVPLLAIVCSLFVIPACTGTSSQVQPEGTPKPAANQGEVAEDQSSPVEREVDSSSAADQAKLAPKVKNKTILESIGSGEIDGSKLQASKEEAFSKNEGATAFAGSEQLQGSSPDEDASQDPNDSADIGDLGSRNRPQNRPNIQMEIKQVEFEGEGELKEAVYKRVVKRKSGHIKRCYLRALKADPDVAGELVISLTVGRAGRVTSSRVDEDGVGSGVGECVSGAVKRWRFPRPKGGSVEVEQPVSLSTK